MSNESDNAIMPPEIPPSVKEFTDFGAAVIKKLEHHERQLDGVDDKIEEVKAEIIVRLELHFKDDDTKFKELFVWKGIVTGVALSFGGLISLATLGFLVYAALK